MINRQKGSLISFFLIVTLIAISLFFLDILIGPKYGGDIEWYIAAAQGHWNELIQPYSTRILHPVIIASLSRFLHLDIYETFSIVAIESLFLFLLINAIILKDKIKKSLFLIPIFFLPFFYNTLRYIFHPDAFYIFLTALFFLFLFYKKEAASLIILFLLFLTRESTIILGLVLIILSWLRSKKLLAIGTLYVSLVSLFIAGSVSRIGQSNIHHLGNFAYTILKFSYNFMANIFGAKFWVDTYHTCAPIFKFSLPQLKIFGNIREAGFCGFDFSLPMNTLITLLTIFGIAPLIFFYFLKKKRDRIFKEFPFWAIIVLIYGLAFYFIGISSGTGVWRIVGYGWPVFLLATPILIKSFFKMSRNFIIKLSLAQLFVAWLPFVIERIAGQFTGVASVSILLVAPVYFWVFSLLKNQETVNVSLSSDENQ